MHVSHCPRCRQTFTVDRDPHLIVEDRSPRVCTTCREIAREPQGEAVRLFSPAPAQLAGQLELNAGTSTDVPMTELTIREAAVAAAALDYMAHHSTLEERAPVLRDHTADLSSAPLYSIANRLREQAE